jgi:hypothetical protein
MARRRAVELIAPEPKGGRDSAKALDVGVLLLNPFLPSSLTAP